MEVKELNGKGTGEITQINGLIGSKIELTM